MFVKVRRVIKNFRALIVVDDGIIGAKGYRICKYNFDNHKIIKETHVKDRKYSLLSRFFLTRRFFRAEITNLYRLSGNTQLLIAKKGIFRKGEKASFFSKCFSIPRGSRPMNLCVDNKENIFWGEYFSNFMKNAVSIYGSFDKGNTWNIVYTFEQGSINHIHGIFYDVFTCNKWIVTGDRENECIIGYSEDDFNTIIEVFRGGQEYRTCSLLFYKDYIIYATDSQYIQNKIKKIDRITLEISDLLTIEGSGIYMSKNSKYAFASTTVEPSDINLSKYSHLYIAENDGLQWREVIKFKKDMWHKLAFQFGSIQFPTYNTKDNNHCIVYSGRSLKNIDGTTIIENIK